MHVQGAPLVPALDPVATSLEARQLAAARTRAWALEHAPNAVGAADADADTGPFSFGTEAHAPTAPVGMAAQAVSGTAAPGALPPGCTGCAAATQAGAPSASVLPAKAQAPPTQAASPGPRPARAPVGVPAAPFVLRKPGGPGGAPQPAPPPQVPQAALVPRPVVWMGLEGSEGGLQPAEVPTRCQPAGSSLPQQQEQHQHQPQVRGQPPGLPRSSHPVHSVGLLPFMDSIPAPPARHSAPGPLPGRGAPSPPSYLDLACVGRRHNAARPPQQPPGHSPPGHTPLSPMGNRSSLPSDAQPHAVAAGSPSGGSKGKACPDAQDGALPASQLSCPLPGAGSTAGEDSSTTTSSSIASRGRQVRARVSACMRMLVCVMVVL